METNSIYKSANLNNSNVADLSPAKQVQMIVIYEQSKMLSRIEMS